MTGLGQHTYHEICSQTEARARALDVVNASDIPAAGRYTRVIFTGFSGHMAGREDYPNYYIDISARLGELGRQPYATRNFFIQYQDRILFGSDMSPDLDAYRLCYRLLETDDEYFNYNTSDVPQQGRWYVYGLSLPEDALKMVYHENARRVLGL